MFHNQGGLMVLLVVLRDFFFWRRVEWVLRGRTISPREFKVLRDDRRAAWSCAVKLSGRGSGSLSLAGHSVDQCEPKAQQ
jgi:hypothetical protein